MTKILVLYYSQTGDVAKIVDEFVAPLSDLPGVELQKHEVRPTSAPPFPWRSLPRLFDVFPEGFYGPVGEIEPLPFSANDRFDLIILGYQIWHLSLSLPIQALLNSEYAQLFNNTKTISVCVSRNMWHSGSELMKKRLRELGAIHLDGVVLTHQGPPLATLISVPRALLFGRRDRLWGVFPPAELSQKDLDRTRRLGSALARKVDTLDEPGSKPLLAGLGAVLVNRRYVLPETIACRYYWAGARMILWLERALGRGARRVGIYLFICGLLLLIVLGLPFSILLLLPCYPWIRRHALQLAQPSGDDRSLLDQLQE